MTLNFIIIFSLTIYLYILANERGGLIQYFVNPIRARQLVVETSSAGNWNILLGLTNYGINLILLSSVLSGVLFSSEKTIYKILSMFSIFLAVLISIVNFSRYALIIPILVWLLSAIFVSYYFDRRKRIRLFKELIVVFLFLFIMFSLFSYIIISLRFFTDEKNISRTYFSQINYYLAGNIVGLDQYLMKESELLWGKGIFRTFYKWFSRLGLTDDKFILGYNYNFVKISPGYVTNTFSYIRSLFEDFGIIGLMILSFIWGIVSGKLTNKYLSSFSVLNLYFVIVISLTFCLSFFGFYFVNLTRVIYEIILFVITSKLFKQFKIYNVTFAQSSF